MAHTLLMLSSLQCDDDEDCRKGMKCHRMSINLAPPRRGVEATESYESTLSTIYLLSVK